MHIFIAIVVSLVLVGGVHADSSRTPRITSTKIYEGDSPQSSVDIAQGGCGSGTDVTREPFYDTAIALTIRNPGTTTLRLQNLRFRLVGGAGGTPRSRPISFVGNYEVPAKSSGTEVQTLLFSSSKGGKFIPGQSARLGALGFQNIEITVTAKDGRNRTVKMTGKTVVSLSNYDRCGANP